MRVYDPRVGRFLSVDPLTQDYPWYTPYQFAGNKPIWAVDLDGMEEWTSNDGGEQQGPWKMEYMAAQGYEPAGSNFVNDFSPGTTPITTLENLKIKEPFERKLSIPAGLIGTSYKENGRAVKLEAIDADPLQGGIGEAEGASGLIPLYGSGRNAISDFQNGRYVSGTFNSVMAISDAFLVKSLAQGVAKGGVQALFKGNMSWKNYRRFYGESGFAEPGQQLHHWIIENNSAIGKSVPNGIKNQMFNLIPMREGIVGGQRYAGAVIHQAFHGNSRILAELSTAQKLWFGTPQWFKAGIVSYGGRATVYGMHSIFEF